MWWFRDRFKLGSKGYRCLLVPDAFFYNFTPIKWKEKFTVKTRRAQHLIELWLRCFKLDLTRNLKLPSLISRIEVFLHIVNPIIFVMFMAYLSIWVSKYPFLLIFSLTLVLPKIRNYAVLYITNHIFLVIALLSQIVGRKQIIWKRPSSEEKARIVNTFYEKVLKNQRSLG